MPSNRKFKLQILYLYLLCLALAAFLWLTTMLGKSYTTEVSIPIRFDNFPANRIAKSELPNTITVGVNGRGFNLLKLQSTIKKSDIVVNVSELLSGNHSNNINIYGQELRERVAQNINPSLSITSLTPEAIHITLAQVTQKRVPIKTDCEISFKKHYTQKGKTTTIPEFITITGAQNTIDSISYVLTDKVTKSDISTNIEEKITLLTIPNVTYSQEYTTLKIETEQLTGAERTSVIGVKNLPANIEITLFPKQVKFTYEVGLSRYEESLKDNFGFFVDYNATKDGSNFLEVKATTIPDYIENLNFTPQRVEYIIE